MVVIGTFAGIIGAMVGIGGGIIVSPALTFMGLMPAQIASTSLIPVSFTSLSSVVAYYRQHKIKYGLGVRMALFAVPGAAVGAILSSILPLGQFKLYFAIILFLTGVYLWTRNKIGRKGMDSKAHAIKNKRTRELVLSLGCLGAGLISSLFGIGGGIVFVPLMLVILELTMSTVACYITAISAHNIDSWKFCAHLVRSSRISACHIPLIRIYHGSTDRCKLIEICWRKDLN